jgi:Cyclic phosphodiesterase-like protein
VRRFKIDRSSAIMIQRAFPARDADTPFVARLQPGEPPFRAWRDQIVPVEHGETEKFPCDFHANRVQPNIFRTGATKTVAIKAGDWIATATFQFASENVGGHEAILTLEVQFVKYWIVKNARENQRVLQAMKKTAIAYWLIPAEPARSFFERTIVDLARLYNAPVFEPHMTIYVGSDRGQADEVIAKAVSGCRLFEAKALKVCQSGEFIKTLFVQFALDRKLQQLNEMIRDAAQDSSDYQLNPHLSLLYKKMSILARHQLAQSIKLPFSEVTFESIKAIRCASPTRNRADVEAWRLVAAKAPSG